MPLHVWCGTQEFEYTHEELAAVELRRQLALIYGESDEFCCLVLNVHCNGEDLDCLILKRNAVIVVDFKECGLPVHGGINGDWIIEGSGGGVLNEGRRNPFRQIRDYRFAVMNHMKETANEFTYEQKASQTSFEHTSGIVCLSPSIHPESRIDIDSGQNKWFHVASMQDVGEGIRSIRSPRISLTLDESRKYIERVLQCKPCQRLTSTDVIEHATFSEHQRVVADKASSDGKAIVLGTVRGSLQTEYPGGLMGDGGKVETDSYRLGFRFDPSSASQLPKQSVDFEQNLDEDQLPAARHAAGRLLILAGAGTGKTRTLIYRAAWLLQTHPPEELMITTFTNQAANELYQRLAEMVGPRVSKITMGTFHSVCHRILRQHAELLGYKSGFAIIDDDDARDILQRCLPQHPYVDLKEYQRALTFSRNALLPLSDAVHGSRGFNLRASGDVLERIARCYHRKVKLANCMDFDDLLENTLKLLAAHPSVLSAYHERYSHILVDEFQDTNRLQVTILELLSRGCDITVVGDDAQSIYAFRAARVENILEFNSQFHGAEIAKLELNHRSTAEILSLANNNISHNRSRMPKVLRPADGKPASEKPWLVRCRDQSEEASFVISRIIDLYSLDFNLKDMAVLYRSRWVSNYIQHALTTADIPFQTIGERPFFGQEHIKDVLAYLRLGEDPSDVISLHRVWKIRSGLDAGLFQELESLAEEMHTTFQLAAQTLIAQPAVGMKLLKMQRLKNFLEDIDSLHRETAVARSIPLLIENVVQHRYLPLLKRRRPSNWHECLVDFNALRDLSLHYATIADLLEAIALDRIEIEGKHKSAAYSQDDMLALSTIHAAKGKEWRTVFVVGVNDNAFPSASAIQSYGTDEEERRLFHVAVTRARELLYLTAPTLMETGSGQNTVPVSRFVSELSSDVYVSRIVTQ